MLHCFAAELIAYGCAPMMKHKTIRALSALAPLALCLITAFAVGCGGPSLGDLCNEICDCTGCSQVERDQCITGSEELEKQAHAANCDDAFDKFVTCIDDNLSCPTDSAALRCQSFMDGVNLCLGAPTAPSK